MLLYRKKGYEQVLTLNTSSIHDYRELASHLDTIILFIQLSVMRQETPVTLLTGINIRKWFIQMLL